MKVVGVLAAVVSTAQIEHVHNTGVSVVLNVSALCAEVIKKIDASQ